jgi:glycosyltransferase involved in cell wall biosynthesis
MFRAKVLLGHICTIHNKAAVFIPNGIQFSSTHPLRITKEKYGLSEGRFVLFMGRLVPEKRPDWLIQAFLELSQKSEAFRTLKLVVAGGSGGTDGYVRGLKELARENPDVIFAGYVWGEEKEELLSQALVFVLPSYLEGNPIALLEAKSYGLCCLASDIEPHREMIQPGRNGQLFRSGDKRDFKARLAELVAHPEEIQKLGKNAREDIRKRKTWEEVVETTLGVYRDILAGGR